MIETVIGSIDIVTGLFITVLVAFILLIVSSKFNINYILPLVVGGILLRYLGVIHENEIFSAISDFGIIFLLFALGIEFSFSKFWEFRKEVFFIGFSQVIFSLILIGGMVFVLSKDIWIAFTLGVIFTMSSTAIIASIVEKKSAIGVKYGRIAFIVALVQDIISVVFLALIPIVFEINVSMLYTTIGGFGVFVVYNALLYFFAKNYLLDILKTRERYLLVFTALLISFGSAIFAKILGLSPFLGAFTAGLVLSDTFFGRHIATELLPLKEVFVSFFFIYVGALLSLEYVSRNILAILGITFSLIFGKFAIMLLINHISRVNIEHNLKSSALISNISEIGFVFGTMALQYKIFSQETFSLVSTSIVISMIVSPFLISLTDYFSKNIILKEPKKLQSETSEYDTIVVGFGPTGQRLVEILKNLKISHIVLETNPTTVSRYGSRNYNIHLVDAKRENVLEWAGVKKSKLLIVTTPVINEAIVIAEKAKSINPLIKIIARAKFSSEVNKLYESGVDVVVCDEIEASKSVIAESLKLLEIKSKEAEAIEKTL